MKNIFKKIFLLFLIFFVSFGLISCQKKTDEDDESNNKDNTSYDDKTFYDGYYSSLVSWTNSEDLKKQLNNIISKGTYKALSYGWEVNAYADQSLINYDYINVIYSDTDVVATDTNNSWNKEHAFPASLMTGKGTSEATKTKGRATDYHNLFASDPSKNNSRGNKSLGNTTNADSYEPVNEDKGRLARAIFYMATMYMSVNQDGTAIDGLPGLSIVESAVSTSGSYSIGCLSNLLAWSKTYSVDRSEFQHNEMVYGHEVNGTSQGNRNPYIDYPELVEYAFGSKKNQAGKLEDLTSSYETLDLDSNEIAYYIVDPSVYEYDTTVTVNLSSDLKVYAVSGYTKDYTTSIYKKVEVTEYAVSGLTSENKLLESTSAPITITIGDKSVTYYVSCEYKVEGASTYKLEFTKDQFASFTDNKTEITYDGITWVVEVTPVTTNSTIGITNNNRGLQFGSSKNGVKNVSIKSKAPVSYDSKTEIESIVFKGSANSKMTYDTILKVSETSYPKQELKYSGNQNEPTILTFNNIGGLNGIVEFSFTTSDTTAFYLYSIEIILK